MNKHNALTTFKKSSAILQAAVIASAALLPAILLSSSANGAPLDNRFIDMSATQTSEGSGRDGGDAAGQDVTYSVGFDVATTGNIQGVVIEFCSDSPIIGDACTGANGIGFDVNEGTLAVTTDSGTAGLTAFTIDAATDTDTLILTLGAAVGVTAGDTVRFDLGTAAVTDGVTNPTATGTFYARILTYATSAPAIAYASAVPGAYVDEGGIALAVANELTVTARVQEVLEFCIGTETSSTGLVDTTDGCAEVSGTNLSLDVVDSNSIATTSTIDTPNDGVMMIRTNAVNGAVMYYKAEQDASANAGKGALKINGSDCSLTITDLDDPCFNSVGTTRAVIAAGVEDFGFAIKDRVLTYGGATDDVVCDGNYAGDANTTLGASCKGAVAGANYAWDDTGVFDTLASSAGPVDDELMALEFAATASPTTPTGLYTVTANFVATATF